MIEYQRRCDDCDELFTGCSPSQAAYNWSQHFKNHHTRDEELETKMIEAARVGWRMGFIDGIAQYGSITKAVQEVEEGRAFILDDLKQEFEKRRYDDEPRA